MNILSKIFGRSAGASSSSKSDVALLMAVLALLLLGLMMVTSVGVPKSIDLSMKIADVDIPYPDCSVEGIDCYLILKQHFARMMVGLVLMFMAWRFPLNFIKKFAPVIYFTAVGLLSYVLVLGAKNGTFASSWVVVDLPFFQSIQPSEMMKLGLILYLAKYISEKMSYEDLQEWDPGFKRFVTIAGSAVLLIMFQPDLGSALVLSGIGAVMYFVAGGNRQHFITGFMIFAISIPIILGLSDHARQRVVSFVNPQEDCREEASCWQTRQASVAIGSGGFFGRGLAKGVQKQYWLPQAVDDFIFSASSEELGFVRMSGIVLLYAYIVYRGFRIAQYASTPFVALAASGISAWIGAQSFINIMVNIGLFPVTGITLPFFSYGGSSMVMTLVAVGILLNLSQYKTNNVYRIHRGGDGRSRRAKPRYSRRTY